MDELVPNFIKYQLYLLQLENYELGRYFKLLAQKGLWPKKNQAQRKELVWTAKAKALMIMAVGLHALVLVVAGFVVMRVRPGVDNLFTVLLLAALIFLPFYFLFFSLALIVLSPLDAYVKNQLVNKAQTKLAGFTNLKVIGIAGSYGKTTMKEILYQVLGARFRVLVTPESINTPVGIARFILNKVTSETQILILELGEHYRGDVKELCQIALPDIAVITGINEAHMERMKILDIIVETVFEAATFAKKKALLVLNMDDKNVAANYGKFIQSGQTVLKYQDANIRNQVFNQDKLAWQGEMDGEQMEIGLLGQYALGNAAAAGLVGRKLGMTTQEIRMGLLNVKPVEHRLQPIRSAGEVLVIDDSYNGNPDGAAEAVKVLGRFNGHRKIYITPGLVETGTATADVHRKIGQQLAGVADVVILIKDSVTPYIEQGILESIKNQVSGIKPEVIWFNTAQEAHQGLKNIIKPGDVVLFQNDWGDQYL